MLRLSPLSLQTDGVMPTSGLLQHLSYPAHLGVVGESVYVMGRESPNCDQLNPSRGPSSVNRLETAGAWTLAWTRVLPRTVLPAAMAATVDGVTVVGGGELTGTPSRGGSDAVLIHLRSDGSVAWSRQFGSLFEDVAERVVPLPGGKVMVVGVTGGALEGQVSQGSDDLFMAQLGADGTTEWFRQFGSSGNERFDDLELLADGSLILSGWTSGIVEPGRLTPPTGSELFLRRMDSTGAQLWTRQFPVNAYYSIPGDLALWGNGFVWSGLTEGVRVAHFSADGTLNWVADGGSEVEGFELTVLDADRVSLHGARELPSTVMLVAGRYLETFETIWSSDGGISETTGLGGGWPRQQAFMFNPVVSHRSNTEWFVGATMLSGNNDVLSVTGFGSGFPTRTVHHDWKFSGPEYLTGQTFTSTTDPLAFGFLQSGALVTLGKALFTPCESGSTAGWLWLTKAP